MSQVDSPEVSWKPLYTLGGAAALASFIIIPIAAIVFIALPPPSFQPTSDTVIAWFAIYQGNAFRGILEADLLLMLAQIFLVPILIALYAGLRKASQSFMAVALAFGLIGVADYIAANPAFSLLSLSSQYTGTTNTALRSQLVAAGQALLAIYQGAPNDVGYVLLGAAILIAGIVMLRSSVFSKRTAYVEIVAGILSLVPSNAGTIGLLFSFLSLIPLAIWDLLLARRFFQLGRA